MSMISPRSALARSLEAVSEEMRIFSGLIAIGTVMPATGCAGAGDDDGARLLGLQREQAPFCDTTRPSMKLMSPTKFATQREFGDS